MNVNFQTQRAYGSKQNTSFGMNFRTRTGKQLATQLVKYGEGAALESFKKYGNDNLGIKSNFEFFIENSWSPLFNGKHVKKFKKFFKPDKLAWTHVYKNPGPGKEMITANANDVVRKAVNRAMEKAAGKGKLNEFADAVKADYPFLAEQVDRKLEAKSLQTLNEIVKENKENAVARKIAKFLGII